jgi:hypothetical protein
MKLTKDIEGCSGGAIYPRVFKAGEECPADLVDAAVALGAVPEKAGKEAKAARAEAERLAREQAEADEAARLAAEQAEADEAARLAAEQGQA